MRALVAATRRRPLGASSAPTSSASAPSTSRSCSAREAYAIEIGNIVEILKPLPITEVPRADPDVVGVMSVRGRLVTVARSRSAASA